MINSEVLSYEDNKKCTLNAQEWLEYYRFTNQEKLVSEKYKSYLGDVKPIIETNIIAIAPSSPHYKNFGFFPETPFIGPPLGIARREYCHGEGFQLKSKELLEKLRLIKTTRK